MFFLYICNKLKKENTFTKYEANMFPVALKSSLSKLKESVNTELLAGAIFNEYYQVKISSLKQKLQELEEKKEMTFADFEENLKKLKVHTIEDEECYYCWDEITTLFRYYNKLENHPQSFDEFIAEIKEALRKQDFAEHLYIKIDDFILKGEVNLKNNFILKIYNNSDRNNLCFTLKKEEKVYWQLDNNQHKSWHIHPINELSKPINISELGIDQIFEKIAEAYKDLL